MLSLVLAAALAAQAAQPAAPPNRDAAAAVSLQRIRRALAEPESRLTLPERTPDFIVDITERQRFDRMIAPFLQFDSGARQKPSFFAAQPQVGTTPALAAIDLLAIASAVRRELSGARRERSARADVARTIAEYCAAQPNGGTAIRICMDPTSVR